MSVTASGSCPDALSVERVLSNLLPAASPGEAMTATVTDQGDEFVVGVGAHTKKYVDPARDCGSRARVAAAFIGLALSPDEPRPSSSAADTATPSAAPVTVAPAATGPSVGPTRTANWLRVDVRGAFEAAPGSGASSAPGGAIGVAGGAGILGARIACGWLSRASINIHGAGEGVLVERFPCNAGAMLQLVPGGRRLEVAADAGLAFGVVRATGSGLAASYESARFELGLHAGLDVILHLGPRRGGLAPLVGIDATYYPRVYDLDVVPRGVVAQTPSLWAGVTAGACWSVE